MITINNTKWAHTIVQEFCDSLDVRYAHERRVERKKSIDQRIGVQKSSKEISFKPKIQYTQNLIFSHKTKRITLAFNSTAKSSVFLLRDTLFKPIMQLPE